MVQKVLNGEVKSTAQSWGVLLTLQQAWEMEDFLIMFLEILVLSGECEFLIILVSWGFRNGYSVLQMSTTATMLYTLEIILKILNSILEDLEEMTCALKAL